MIILIDSSSICHAAKHTMGDLSFEDKKVGVMFGFMVQLLTLSRKFESNKFVFAWDTRPYLRSKIYPGYKVKDAVKTVQEKELDDIAYAQFHTIQCEILPEIGFVNNFWQDGYEADDIIASVVKSNPREKIMIISTDEDLYQLLSENVSMYSIKKKQEFTYNNLWKEYRVPPQDWPDVKAISGCSSDKIPGVSGAAEKTACKYLNRQLSIVRGTYKAIKDNKELIERNLKLVTLPFPGVKTFLINHVESLSVKEFLNICQRYGFQSFMYDDNFAKWKQYIFNMGVKL